ncbi:MAG: hypothetical protein M3P84_06660 [Chloroflexota bacterium]|nr:hypothetical protein [Chloroflexota bacterium]
MTGRLDRTTMIGLAIAAVSAVVYWLSNRNYDATRGDFFYLADAFLHGRTWLDVALGPNDVIPDGAKFYVPFAPFPAIALMPLVAIVGPVTADQWESGINALLAASVVGLGWWLLGRIGVEKVADRARLVILLGFSTQIWWVTTRGGVWHTGHLIATILTLLCLIELFGRRRAFLIGLMAGAAFLTRAPVAFALPLYALLLAGDAVREPRLWPWRTWLALAAGFLPAIVFFFWYNAVRFGTPLESGYALATLPPWLEAQRQLGLFSVAHIPMNLNYLLIHLPGLSREFPFFRPDGLGMSIFITSPALLYATRAPWREMRTWLLAGAALVVLVPTLLYYGGGWLQYGYRYALDSIPFIWVLCGLAAVRDEQEGGEMSWLWRILIGIGLIVGVGGVYWAYNL